MLPRLFRFSELIQKLYSPLLLLFCFVFFTACETKTDLSSIEPYVRALGKEFVLQKDYYVFKVDNGMHLCIGEDFYLPKSVDKKYIGLKNGDAYIVGIAKKGTILKIKKFIEEYATLAGTFDYLYVAIDGHSDFGDVNADSLRNSIHNPPTTKTWSDPPIFDPKAALPLPSDGIWWK